NGGIVRLKNIKFSNLERVFSNVDGSDEDEYEYHLDNIHVKDCYTSFAVRRGNITKLNIHNCTFKNLVIGAEFSRVLINTKITNCHFEKIGYPDEYSIGIYGLQLGHAISTANTNTEVLINNCSFKHFRGGVISGTGYVVPLWVLCHRLSVTN